MHRIDTSTAQKDKFGSGKNGFTGGNPQTGELPTALDADFFDSVQEEIAAVIEAAGITLAKASNAQLLAAMKALVGPGRLLGVQGFSASATYTPKNGTKLLVIDVLGGGGAGGSSSAASTAATGLGTGGGGGGYTRSIVYTVPSSQNVTVGTGGQPSSSGTSGGNGGSSSFGSVVANGGVGGINNFGATWESGTVQQRGGAAGTASGGNLVNAPGGIGAQALWTVKGNCISGSGGSSAFSGSTLPVGGSASAGVNGGPGAGGSGANSSGNTGILLGGAGGNGFVLVWEYA